MAEQDIGGLHMKLTADIAQLEAALAQARALSEQTAAAMAASADRAASAYQGVASAATQAGAASRSFGLGGGGVGGFGSRGGVGRASPFPNQAPNTTWVQSLTARLGPLVTQLREVSKYAGIGLGLLARASAVVGVATAAIYALGNAINYVWKNISDGEARLRSFKTTLDLSDATGSVKKYADERKKLEKSVVDTYDKLQNAQSVWKFLPWNRLGDLLRVRSAMKDIANLEADYAQSGLRRQVAAQSRFEKAKKETEELRKQLDLLKQIQDQQRGRYSLYDVVFSINANTEILKDIASRIK
jgi:hypothetical protein